MDRVLYKTPGDFLEENRDFLLKYEALAQLNFGNATAHRAELCRPGLLFGRYEEKGEPVLLFGNTLPWNICLNGEENGEGPKMAAAELARYLREENVEIAGVNARGELAESFMKAFGGAFTLRSAMDVMVLRELLEHPAVPGRVRKAESRDLELVVQWLCAFSAEALGEQADPDKYRQSFAPRVEKGCVYLFETPEGEAVSMASTTRDLPHGAGVSAVYTPPAHRGKGYCQCTVAALCREKLMAGKDYCTLFVNKQNPISNKVYKKLGFVAVEDCFDYKKQG